jgi:hypothetical protein
MYPHMGGGNLPTQFSDKSGRSFGEGDTPPQVGPVTYTVTVTLTDTDGSSATTTSTVVVGAIAVGAPATMSSWLFQDQNTYAAATDFVASGQTSVASVNWGDGTSSLATVTGGPGNGSGVVNFTVSGPTHTYTLDSLNQPNGQYAVTVTVTDTDGSTLSGTQYVSVVRPPMAAWANQIVAQPGVALTNVQAAAFAVPNATDAAGEFTATINWGDGNTSAGTIQQVTPGLFQVLGSHLYAAAGFDTLLVTISQSWPPFLAAAAVVGQPQVGVLPSIMLYSLDFKNSLDFSNGIMLQRDDNFANYSPNQWLDNNLNGVIDAGDHQYPYAYVSGAKSTVTAVFKPRKGFTPPAQLHIKGILSLNGGDPAEPLFTDNFPDPNQQVQYTQNQYTYNGSQANKLPKLTEGVPQFDIDWQYSLDGQHWLPAGSSSNHVYLTYRQLTSAFVRYRLQTVFAYAASDRSAFDDGGNPLTDLLNEHIWFNFSNRGLPADSQRALDGKPLHYYGNWRTQISKYYDLVSKMDGQCSSWAGLLAAAMLADGLNTVGNWKIYIDTIVAKRTYSSFLVNNWHFAAGIKNLNTNYYDPTLDPALRPQRIPVYLKPDHYEWLNPPAAQATDLPGIAGQNQGNPASFFIRHCIIELDTPNLVTLYDPSYGTMYQKGDFDAALTALQAAAIAGFGTSTQVSPTKIKLEIRPNSKLGLLLEFGPFGHSRL